MKDLSEECKLLGYRALLNEVVLPRMKNNDFIRSKIWGVKDSIFAPHFSKHTPLYMSQCFESDWKMTKAAKMKNKDDKIAIFDSMNKHYRMLKVKFPIVF